MGVPWLLVALLIVLDAREQALIGRLIKTNGLNALEGQSQVLSVLDWVYQTDRDFDPEAGGLRAFYYRHTPFYPAVDQLLVQGHPPWHGHCGTLSRTTLRKQGIPSEKLQIGGNVDTVVEVSVDGRPVIVDPLYNLRFVHEGGRQATKEEFGSGARAHSSAMRVPTRRIRIEL